MSVTPFYRMKDGLYEPQEAAQGYWNRSHQNGVAAGGLLAQLCDTHQASDGMRTCRVTIDIMRGVPYEPIAATCRLVRDGARVQVLEAEIAADGQVFARASALRVRTGETPSTQGSDRTWPLPESVGDAPVMRNQVAGFAVETRLVKGSMRELGPGAYWARFNAALVEGQETTPVARTAMAADIGSGPSSVVDSREWSFANLDLSIHLFRPPVGEWVYAESETFSAGDGAGIVNSRLGDRDGYIGVANQVLYIASRQR